MAGLRVMVKPNLISAKKGPLACTEAEFTLAVSRWFIDNGAQVIIGDSPAFGSATSVLTRLGVVEDIRFLGVEISDFSSSRKLSLASGVEADMAVDALDCDLLVNLPRVKAHAQMRVTLAVKNFFGCLTGLQKPWWHMVHGGDSGRFSDLLVELLSVLPESMTLVDGIRAMHVTGPINGKPYPLQIIAAGTNPVAVDAALLSILGVSAERSSLHRAAIHAQIAGTSSEYLSFPLATASEMQVNDFLVPERLSPIRFNPFVFLRSSLLRKLMFRKINNK